MGNWQERIDELESENFDLQESVGTLEDEMTENLYEIDRLNDELGKVRQRFRDYTIVHPDNEHQLNVWRERAESARAVKGELEAKLREAMSRIEYEKKRAEKAEAANRDWEGVAECARERTEKAETQIEVWKDCALEVEKDLEQCQLRAEQAEYLTGIFEDERDKAKARVRDLERLLATEVNRAEKAENDRSQMLAELHTISDIVGGNWFSIGSVEFDVSAVVEDRDTYKRLLEEAQTELAELYDRIDERGWAQGTIDYYRERAEKAEADLRVTENERERAVAFAKDLKARSNSRFEIAKQMTRARNLWKSIADKHLDQVIEAEKELSELKAALRVLGA
ncbi:coiled-coil domain-containing protein [Saccharopolyspora pogona]|uniref:hypothetical protein n=1 Tax=Saccharopolyspora pogona TaxID=333966 RepID=UPI0016860F72|nr:hypothetical protein [Saccharopolyspora pogona]